MIKLSEIPEYLAYGDAIAKRDYEGAKRNIAKCIEIATSAGETETVALLLQFMGDTELDSGNVSAAMARYHEAELNAPDSPLTRLMFAKFLVSRCSDAPAAIKKCDEAEDILRSKWHPEPDDLTEEEYKLQINEIRKMAEQINRDDRE